MGNSTENALKNQPKTKPTTKQGKQRQRHAFAKEEAVILQVVQVVKTARKQQEEEPWPPCWSNRFPRAQSFPADGRAAGWLRGGCEGRPGCGGRVPPFAHAMAISLGLQDGKAPQRKTLNHGLSWRGVDPKDMLKCFPGSRLGFGCVKITTSVCLPLWGGKAPD